jgi:WD40 repeat protein
MDVIMFPICPSKNICALLKQREYGKKLSVDRSRYVYNIAKGNYTIAIGNKHLDNIHSLDVNEHFAATAAFDHTIKLWDCDTGQCKWSFVLQKAPSNSGILKIVNEHIIYSYHYIETTDDTMNISTSMYETLFIDLKTGIDICSFQSSDLYNHKIVIIKDRIFGRLREGNLAQFESTGKLVRIIPTSFLADPREHEFLTADDFLVTVFKNTILIYDSSAHAQSKDAAAPSVLRLIATKTGVSVCLAEEEQAQVFSNGVHITSCCIDGLQLVCCMHNRFQKNSIDCCIIDLVTREIIDQYRILEADLEDWGVLWKYNYLEDSAEKIIKENEWLYLGCNSGRVIAVNMIKKGHAVLGCHDCNNVHDLALDSNILVSASNDTNSHIGILKIWDITTFECLETKKLPSLIKTTITGGKIHAITENSLVQWDFLVLHEGKKFAANSALGLNISTTTPRNPLLENNNL